eukprot:2105833-Pyramimonas_sp.AAC.1
MESSAGSKAILLDAIPRVFYDRTQQDAGEFLQEVLNDERAPVVSELFLMEKVERLVRTREGCDGATVIKGDRDLTCLVVQIPRGDGGRVRTVQEAVDRSSGGEMMEAGHRWTCPKGCGCRAARKEWQLTRAPQ